MNVKTNGSTQPSEINWNKRQLVERIEGNRIIVMTTIDKAGVNPSMFTGVNIETGEFELYFKKLFKPFNGTITLSND